MERKESQIDWNKIEQVASVKVLMKMKLGKGIMPKRKNSVEEIEIVTNMMAMKTGLGHNLESILKEQMMDSMEELTALRIQETVEDGMEQMMMTGMMRMMANTEKIVQKIERIEIIVANMMKKTIMR